MKDFLSIWIEQNLDYTDFYRERQHRSPYINKSINEMPHTSIWHDLYKWCKSCHFMKCWNEKLCIAMYLTFLTLTYTMSSILQQLVEHFHPRLLQTWLVSPVCCLGRKQWVWSSLIRPLLQGCHGGRGRGLTPYGWPSPAASPGAMSKRAPDHSIECESEGEKKTNGHWEKNTWTQKQVVQPSERIQTFYITVCFIVFRCFICFTKCIYLYSFTYL